MVDNVDTSQARAIVTVLGSDQPGIVAAVSGTLAGHDINILDISQTILKEIFTMTMLVDVSASDVEFKQVQEQQHGGSEDRTQRKQGPSLFHL